MATVVSVDLDVVNAVSNIVVVDLLVAVANVDVTFVPVAYAVSSSVTLIC